MKRIIKWFKRSPKEREGWMNFYVFSDAGSLVQVRKYGTKDSTNWEPCLIATSEDLSQAKKNQGFKDSVKILSRNDFNKKDQTK